MAPAAMPNGRSANWPITTSSSGTATIETRPNVTIRPTAYDEWPPALPSFLGSSGGIGEIASATSATSTSGRKSKTRTSSTTSAGITTKTASSERTSRPGRRNT